MNSIKGFSIRARVGYREIKTYSAELQGHLQWRDLLLSIYLKRQKSIEKTA
jgi:hypothetical protein